MWHRFMTSSVELKRKMTSETKKKVMFLQAQMLAINFRIHNSHLKFLSVSLFLIHIEKLGIKIWILNQRFNLLFKRYMLQFDSMFHCSSEGWCFMYPINCQLKKSVGGVWFYISEFLVSMCIYVCVFKREDRVSICRKSLKKLFWTVK